MRQIDPLMMAPYPKKIIGGRIMIIIMNMTNQTSPMVQKTIIIIPNIMMKKVHITKEMTIIEKKITSIVIQNIKRKENQKRKEKQRLNPLNLNMIPINHQKVKSKKLKISQSSRKVNFLKF